MFPQETHILVVDDSINIRNLICENLKVMGFKKIEAASDAKEAFTMLDQAEASPLPFRLVLSDLNMPGPSGIDLLHQVRADVRFEKLPFVLVTTESEKGAVIEAAVAGVSSYIVKPFNVETLTMRLREAWKKHNP